MCLFKVFRFTTGRKPASFFLTRTIVLKNCCGQGCLYFCLLLLKHSPQLCQWAKNTSYFFRNRIEYFIHACMAEDFPFSFKIFRRCWSRSWTPFIFLETGWTDRIFSFKYFLAHEHSCIYRRILSCPLEDSILCSPNLPVRIVSISLEVHHYFLEWNLFSGPLVFYQGLDQLVLPALHRVQSFLVFHDLSSTKDAKTFLDGINYLTRKVRVSLSTHWS